ncbi:MAG TPA: response regulator [Pirellulales bacterium]|jgi:CheY-like chemotaxis protein
MVTSSPQQRLRILIVDDNRDLTTVLQKAFTVCGQSAVVANDGERAMELARKLPLDVIVCDLDMPGMDGFTLVRRMRDDPAMPYHPVCAFTGRGDEACRRQAIASGFEGFIVKTARFPEVLDFLKRYKR